MNTIIINLLVGFMIILMGYYNGWIFKMTKKRDEYANNKVHRIGGLLRALMILLVILNGIFNKDTFSNIVLWTLIQANLSWTFYDLIYNKINNHKWYYSGNPDSHTASVIDKWLYRYDEGLKLILLAYTIAWHWVEPFIQQSICFVIMGIVGVFMFYRFKK